MAKISGILRYVTFEQPLPYLDWRESVDIKSCPGCNVAVEREGGCAHMTCGIGVCSQEWCWLCEKKWNLECREDHWFD